MPKHSDKHSPKRAATTVRRVPKVAEDVLAQGQTQGQLKQIAARYRVSEHWLRLVALGTLDDPVFVWAIRKAAKAPRLWALVSPAAQEALAMPTVKIRHLGGTLDDLLATLLECIDIMGHPINRNFALHTTPLQHVRTSLDIHLQNRLDADVDRGRRNLKGTQTANKMKSTYAAERARKWLAEVESRRPGAPKKATYDRIARQKKTTSDAVKKAIDRYVKRTARK